MWAKRNALARCRRGGPPHDLGIVRWGMRSRGGPAETTDHSGLFWRGRALASPSCPGAVGPLGPLCQGFLTLLTSSPASRSRLWARGVPSDLRGVRCATKSLRHRVRDLLGAGARSGTPPCLEAEGTGTQSGRLCLSFGARAFSAPVTYRRLAELSVSNASPRSGRRTGLLQEQRALDHKATQREARGLTSKWGRIDFSVSTPPSPVCAQ